MSWTALPIALTLAACAAPGQAELPDEAVVLPPSATAVMLRQCSRRSPPAGEATWQPAAADIVALEAALPAALAANHAPGSPDGSRLNADWLRQYVGLLRGGRRFIYGNFFPREAGPVPGEPDRWRSQPVIVCDGGPSFFGVEYDVEAGRIMQVDFNGGIA